jgi:hypothetical protein
LQLLNPHFKLGTNRFDLLLANFGSLFQIITDIAHLPLFVSKAINAMRTLWFPFRLRFCEGEVASPTQQHCAIH